jgi:GMC oxidoreductase
MKRRLIIVGAGLGGCCLADAMAESWDVTVVELGASGAQQAEDIVDVGRPAVTHPHVDYGLGGTTSVWHNGLIEIAAGVFDRFWPFPKSELEPYYAAAFSKLSGASRDAVKNAVAILRQKMQANGVPEDLMGQGLYYPRHRINVWSHFLLTSRVSLVAGEVSGFLPDDSGGVRGVVVRCGDADLQVEGDAVVLAAGGLGTPILLQKLAQSLPSSALQHAGRHYEDHPTGFVAEIILEAPIYKLWNFSTTGLKGNLRLPVVVEQDGLQISFQFRPAAQFGRRNKLSSMLNELRNEPYNVKNYVRLLAHVDDIMDILSFRFGWRWPTKNYSLLMVAQQPPDSDVCVWRNANSASISRRWNITHAYIGSLEKAMNTVIEKLNCKKTAHIFPEWADDLKSSAHHSGTARMSASPEKGVCDSNAQVHGFKNLFVCDGSLIPASGHANTGLTIAALALRLAQHFKHQWRGGANAVV